MGAAQSVIRRWLGAGPGVRFVAVLAGGTAIGQGLVLLATPAISRMYTRADIGAFGLFISFMSVASVVATGRYEFAIPGARDDDEANDLLALGLALSVAVSVLSAGALWLLIRYNVLSYGTLPEWSALAMVPALFAFGMLSVLRYWYVRYNRFREISRVLVAQGSGRAVVPVILGVFGPGVLGLIAGEIIGRALGVAGLMRGAAGAVRSGLRNAVGMKRVAAINWKYPGILLPSSLADVLALALPVPLVASAYGTSAAGALVIVQRLTTAPAALVGTSVGDVFHSSAARLSAAGPGAMRVYLDRTAARLLGIGALLLVPAAALAPAVLPWVLGAEWTDAGRLFVALAPWSLAAFVVMPVSRALFVSEKKELKLIYDVVGLGALLGAILFARAHGMGFLQAMALVSAGQVAAYVLYFVLLRIASAHLENRGVVA